MRSVSLIRAFTGLCALLCSQVLLPTLQAMRPGGAPYTLQHDNAPQHEARATVRWLGDQPEVSRAEAIGSSIPYVDFAKPIFRHL